MDTQSKIDIKKLYSDKIIKIQDNILILDIKDFVEYDFKLYDKFLESPVPFMSELKEEAKSYNLNKPELKFMNWVESKDISRIRVENIGQIVKVDGMISKITDPLALVISKKWRCPSCGTLITTPGKTKVNRCSCGRTRGFMEESQHLQNIQELILEELQERTGGKQPQKIRIRIKDELTDKKYSELLKPGNRVSIIGIIDKIPLNNKQEEEIFQYRIIGIQIMDLEDKFDDTLFEEDLKRIEEISVDNPIEKLKDSIAPNIWGREDLKKILLLQMVGGVQKELGDGKLTRDWINILVVGSPSTSKTELAKNVNIRCPKSFYASGDNASGVGLTVAMAKDELLGSWGIEVGPLVKANKSLLVCDELDKFPKEQLKALHTPLESGLVKLSKAGVDGKFPAETALLALANPKYGIFEDNKPLVDQVNLPPALLSRFDIIHILKDDVDKDSDDRIAEIIYVQSKKEKKDIIDVQLFRKYITHAKTLKPSLPMEHLKDLQEFYHDVRKKSISTDSKMKGLPIGTRHLQGLIRMAEASAKLRLSDTVDKEDFELAKRLFYDALLKIGLDEGGIFDMARVTNSSQTISKRKLRDFLMDTLRTLCKDGEEIRDHDLQMVMAEKGMTKDKYLETIESLNREGSILQSGNSWRLL